MERGRGCVPWSKTRKRGGGGGGGFRKLFHIHKLAHDHCSL